MVLCSFSRAHGAEAPQPAFDEYEQWLKEEQLSYSSRANLEVAISGLAGLTIGLYGYFFTDSGPGTRLLYAATQTAGVVTFGEAIRQYYSSSLLMALHERMEGHENLSREELKSSLLKWRRDSKRAMLRSVTYTSAILSVLYCYDGIREESDNSTVKNIYFFLSGNTALIAAVGTYKIVTNREDASGAQLSLLLNSKEQGMALSWSL